jgi:hypothetical protein
MGSRLKDDEQEVRENGHNLWFVARALSYGTRVLVLWSDSTYVNRSNIRATTSSTTTIVPSYVQINVKIASIKGR